VREPSGHRADAEHSPLLLVAAFAVVAAIVFALFQLVDSGDDGTGTALDESSPSTVASDGTTATLPPTEKGQTLKPDAGARVGPGGPIKVNPKLKRRVRHSLRPTIVPTDGRSGTGLSIGPVTDVNAPVGSPVTGTLTVADANIPNRTNDSGWVSSMHTLTGAQPDFITLNEVGRHSTAGIEAVAPGYGAYRDPVPDRSTGGAGQSMNNVVMWRSDRWTLYDAGRFKVVDNDNGYYNGRPFTWDRYATWAVLERTDGAVASVISVHMPTNPRKFPKQHGANPMSRAAQYGHGMDLLNGLVRQLSQYGPVLVGGDMNSHASDGSWAAAPKMTAAGYHYTKDSGVIYLFFPGAATVLASREVHVVSDHPALITQLDMNGIGPSSG
jgi:endonuclease/exonuclease/phosphatase family metal-dependent hydrolase